MSYEPMGDYEPVNGYGGFGLGGEYEDLLGRPSVQVTGGSAPGTGERPPPIVPDWTTQAPSHTVYSTTPSTRGQPAPSTRPTAVTVGWAPPSTRPPPLSPPRGQRPAGPMPRYMPAGPPQAPPVMAQDPGCPVCTPTSEIPWLFIALATAAGVAVGYVIKGQMKKKPGEEGGVS